MTDDQDSSSERERRRNRCYEEYVEAVLQGDLIDPGEFLARYGADDAELRQTLEKIHRFARRRRKRERG